MRGSFSGHITYSVIIPHYRIPELLVRCLESIPVRDDIQIIVVDDDSPGREDYRDRYPVLLRDGLVYIEAPHNGGIGYARNLGMPYAEGEWLVFCDADDTFRDGAFDRMDSYSGSDAEIVYFRPGVMIDGDWKPGFTHSWFNELYDNYKASGDDRLIRSFHVTAWSKMIKREWCFENNFSFEEIRFSEDVSFSTLTGTSASKVIVCDDVVYNYHLRQGSNSFLSTPGPNYIYERARVAMCANKLLQEKYDFLYLDAYEALLKLFKYDKKAFLSLVWTAPENKISISRLLGMMFKRMLRKLVK